MSSEIEEALPKIHRPLNEQEQNPPTSASSNKPTIPNNSTTAFNSPTPNRCGQKEAERNYAERPAKETPEAKDAESLSRDKAPPPASTDSSRMPKKLHHRCGNRITHRLLKATPPSYHDQQYSLHTPTNAVAFQPWRFHQPQTKRL